MITSSHSNLLSLNFYELLEQQQSVAQDGMREIEDVPSETAVVPFVAGKAHVLSYPPALATVA